MGLAVTCYLLLALLGVWMTAQRWQGDRLRPRLSRPLLRQLHMGLGIALVILILVLLAIGIVGTLGHFGSLGHSWHLPAGLIVVALTLASAASAWQFSRSTQIWAREIHVVLNLALGGALVAVGISGWTVVQKYLPH